MPARLIDGKAVAERRRAALAGRVPALIARGIEPCLAAITVAADHGWSVYEANQAKACAAVGIRRQAIALPAGADQEALLEAIEQLNVDPAVHGIIVQSPLPAGFDAFAAQGRISPDKDVECVGAANLGLLLAGRSTLAPCTALSAFALTLEALPDLRGVEAVVVGASTIVGKPVAQLLTTAGATVTICQLTTRDVAAHCRTADLVIVAVGKAGLVTADWIKPGAVVIDVGINRVTAADGKQVTVGDVAPEVAAVAGALTPVPGGVGALTTTILLESTVAAAERLASSTNAIDGRMVARLLGGLDLPAETSERIATLLSRHLVGSGTGERTAPIERRLAAIRGTGGALILDGAMGSELIARNVAPAAVADANLSHPDLVLEVHRAYLAAGADVVTTNTFALNRYRRRDRDELVKLLTAGVRLARQAAAGKAFVLGSIGPLGPVVGAELDAATASDAVAEIALVMQDAQVDAFMLETMPSTVEAAAALAGIRRVSRLPVLVSRTIERAEGGELAEFARAMEDGGASAVGVNCAAGPRALRPVVAALARATRLPVLARPNAGFPAREADGRLVYHLRPDYLLEQARGYLHDGVGLLGGCCGVGPAHIQALATLKGASVAQPAPAALSAAEQSAPRPAHPLLQAFAAAAFPVFACVPGRLALADATVALTRLATAGAASVGLLAGWPGSVRGTGLVAGLAHLARSAGVPAVLELPAGDMTLAAAEEQLHAAHLLGIRTVLIDAGVFVGGNPDAGGVDPVRLLWLVRQLNLGRNRAGNHQQPTAFAVGVRVPSTDRRHGEYVAAGADFLTLQPVYQPATFRAVMAEVSDVGIPVLAEVLLLPDAATADELDNELPALSVPEALKHRLAHDPDEDVRGVLRFLAAWRPRLAGVCVLTADARVDAAVRVVASISKPPA